MDELLQLLSIMQEKQLIAIVLIIIDDTNT